MWLDPLLIQQNQIQRHFDRQLPRVWMLPGRYAGSTASRKNLRIVSTDACIVYGVCCVSQPEKRDHLGRIVVNQFYVLLAFYKI